MSTSDSKDLEPKHPIGVVARRTGLKPDLIRAWERRYEAVEPARSDSQRRFYSDADISRLALLRDATQAGRSIGQVAHMADGELRELIREDRAAAFTEPVAPAPHREPGPPLLPGEGPATILERCLAAIQRLEARELEAHLERASVRLSKTHLIDQVLVPLMRRIGDLWEDGTLRPAHEHMASAVVRSFLGHLGGGAVSHPGAPYFVVTTPAGQRHELGALIAAANANSVGWNVTYLGPDLPAEEISAAALEINASAVGLSLVYPPDDPLLAGELDKLHRLLPPGTAILVGGRAVPHYRHALQAIDAEIFETSDAFRRRLSQLRQLPAGASRSRGRDPQAAAEPDEAEPPS